jgi:hypothetical protein
MMILLAGALGLAGIAAVLVLAGGDDGAPESQAETAEPAGAAGAAGAGAADAPEEAPTPAPTEPDELCVLHADLVAVTAPIGDVENEDEFQRLTAAQITFYDSAAGVVAGAEAAAFLGLAEYYEALRGFHEARGWGASLDLTAIAQLPRPPNDAAAIVRDLLQARCGVAPPADPPG